MDEYVVEECNYMSAMDLQNKINFKVAEGFYLIKIEKIFEESNRYGQETIMLLIFCRTKTAKLLYDGGL